MCDVAAPAATRTWLDREWDTFRCRKCQRVLFKFDDGQRERMLAIQAVRKQIQAASDEGRLSAGERAAIEATFKHEHVVEIKCTLTACKTMNYLMESVR